MSDVTIPLLRAEKRWFTPAEANELLPEIVGIVESLAEGIERAREVASLLEAATDIQDRWAVNRDLAELQDANREALEQLETYGVEIRSVAPALVDFPALRHGQEVYLCWREGETEITWWHPVHTGMRGRQAVEPDSAAAWDYWS